MTYQGRSRRLCAVGCTLNLFPRPPKLLAAAGVSILACYGSRKPEAAPIVETASGLTAGELAGSKEPHRRRNVARCKHCRTNYISPPKHPNTSLRGDGLPLGLSPLSGAAAATIHCCHGLVDGGGRGSCFPSPPEGRGCGRPSRSGQARVERVSVRCDGYVRTSTR